MEYLYKKLELSVFFKDLFDIVFVYFLLFYVILQQRVIYIPLILGAMKQSKTYIYLQVFLPTEIHFPLLRRKIHMEDL